MTETRDPIQHLIEEFRKLPGIGPKSAQRLVFHLLKRPEEESRSLAQAILDLKARLGLCSECNNISDLDPCRICRDPRRDRKTICIVEEPFNVLSIEHSGSYRGLYHVLHGVISPAQGIGPEELRLETLLRRLAGEEVEEVIIATNPTAEGEATALYLARLIKPSGVKVTRIGVGIPMGSDIEYADALTISKALSGRSSY
ncbi:MAG TPA: recombination mediator RecR [Acidobacteriota bacterium]|nr:recombination mediator RecR [Acidobacteriota bacterium]HRR55689.1 recombination mediator RecR [Acidobacteriota bacterium]